MDNQNDTERVKILFRPETNMRLKNLTSYTYYMVKLSAFNAAGDGPFSEPRRGRTLQAAPSAPSFISFSEVTSSTLNVSWGFPLSPNGVVEGYRVVYEPTAPIQGVTKVVTVDIRGSWQRWLKVRDLTKGVTYCFCVQAKTIAYGPEAEANITAGPVKGSPGSPVEMSITKTGSMLNIHWTPGETGGGHVTGYVIEARPSDEGMWDTFVRHLPPTSTSHSVSLDRLRQGISYQFRVLAINEFGYGEPSAPSAAMSAQLDTPFYEEWWFLVVLALCGLILLLLVVFGLVLHGQNRKYKSCGTGKVVSTVEETVTLDNGGFTALELNSRPVHVKGVFLRKNGTRSPPRPNPAGLRYSDEDICSNYNGVVSTESTALTERPAEMSESEATDSECEEEPIKHSFVNHYMSDPSYFNSWKRQQKGLKQTLACSYDECASGDTESYYQTVVTQHSVGGVYTPAGQPAPGSRTPVTGFSSFV
ncbi:sidekick-1-like isoform X2 [Labeo rohita]|uniref:Sidekick-1-like isoform X2 n=3 Tax=Labeo rohita TaxID=84645 RepID=A0A498M9P1_LABRO|nr:sidekick-1-like isoform X2 [Labeo rohita]